MYKIIKFQEMDKFSVDIVPVYDIQGKYPYIRRAFEKGLNDLSPQARTVLELQGSRHLIEALNRCTDGCKVVTFGDVLNDSHATSPRLVVWEDIKQLERKNVVVKLCFIKPTEVEGQISLSDADAEMVENLQDTSNVEFIMQNSTIFHLSCARFEIFVSLKKKLPNFNRLWLANHLNDEVFEETYLTKFYEIADNKLLEEVTYLREKTENFYHEIQDRRNIENIVYGVVDGVCNLQNIVQISRSARLTNERDNEIVGNVHSLEYNTMRSWLVKDLKRQLVDIILKTLSDSIANQFKERFNKFMADLVDVPSGMISETMEWVKEILPDDVIVHEIQSIIMLFFTRIKDFLVDIVMVIVTWFSPVNINSNQWRDKIAKDISHAVGKIQTELKENVVIAIMSQLAFLYEIVRPNTITFLKYMESNIDETRYDREKVPMDFVQSLKYEHQKESMIGEQRYERQIEHRYTEREYLSEVSFRNACKDWSSRGNFNFIDIYPGTLDGNHVIVSLVSKLDNKVPANYEFASKKYPLIFKRVGEPSKEVTKINAFRNNNEVQVDRKLRQKATRFINQHGETLMQQHSNLTSISVSAVKSKNGGETISKQTCIVLYCTYKGVIPLAELKFPTQLDGIPVDVREGFVLPAVGCRDFCNPLSIGCSIGLKGRPSSGSLGLFLQEKGNRNNHGFITCYHVLLDVSHPGVGNSVCRGNGEAVLQPAEPDIELFNRNQSSLNDVEMLDETANREGVTDYQQNTEMIYSLSQMPNPETNDRYICGYLKHAYHGNITVRSNGLDIGVDVAYVQIASRDPQKAIFPDIAENLRHKFPKEELEIGDAIEEMYGDEADIVVYKYGRTTGLTRGTFDCAGSMLNMNLGRGIRILKNQYEIISSAKAPFFSLGDSGAAIFEKRGSMLHCIGLGIAISDDDGSRCFVTPISAALTALSSSCPELEVRKFISPGNLIFPGATTSNTYDEPMENS